MNDHLATPAASPAASPTATGPSSPQPTRTRSDAVGTAVVRVGIALFVVGLVAIIVTFAAPVFDVRLSDYFYIAAMACPLGLVVGVVGALVSGRRRTNVLHEV